MASVHDFVVRAISGHATTSMQEHYSIISGDEARTGLAKVIAPGRHRGNGVSFDPRGIMTTKAKLVKKAGLRL